MKQRIPILITCAVLSLVGTQGVAEPSQGTIARTIQVGPLRRIYYLLLW